MSRVQGRAARRAFSRATFVVALALGATGCTLTEGDPPATDGGARAAEGARPAGRVPVAVLGDSDSHGYRDDILGTGRGGAYHERTFQWTEVLAELRASEIDLGPVAPWGQRGVFARFRDRMGFPARTPRKNDFLFNFAVSGATCATLNDQWPQQVRWAVSRLEDDPERWAAGLVVIRVGVNDLGQLEHLETFAKGGLTPEAETAIRDCAHEIRDAVLAIRAVSPAAVLVVGIADDSSWPASLVPDWTPEEVSRIRVVLDQFDARVAETVGDIDRVAFMDDRAWYYDRWPDRDSTGRARTAGVGFGGATPVTNTMGDHPSNLVLEDGHAGTMANGLWAQSMIRAANEAFGFGLTPLSEAEVADLADEDQAFGIASSEPRPDTPPRLVPPYDEVTLSVSDLPFMVGPIEAWDDRGEAIGASSVAYLTTTDGSRLWLFGGGDRLRLEPGRHVPGTYDLVIRVRDRSGTSAQVTLPVTLRGENEAAGGVSGR